MDARARELKQEQIRTAFANNFRLLRKRKGLTQQQLADALSIHRVTVVRIESGVHMPLYTEACLAADLFGVSIAAMRVDLEAVPET